MSINQFRGELDASLSSLTALMKSDFCMGIPVMVSNSVEADRNSVVTAVLNDVKSKYVRVFDDKGKEVKSQCSSLADGSMEVLFLADVTSLGVRVYDVRPSDEPCRISSVLTINGDTISNQKYEVRLNKNGDIQSIIDKEDNDRELLAKPVVLGQFNYTGSKDWPAWEMNYNEANKEPDRIPSCVTVKVKESGPVRVSLSLIHI